MRHPKLWVFVFLYFCYCDRYKCRHNKFAIPISDSPDCKPPQNLTHGNVTLLNGTTTYLSMANYTCHIGYHLTENSSSTTCQADKSWDNQPNCTFNGESKCTMRWQYVAFIVYSISHQLFVSSNYYHQTQTSRCYFQNFHISCSTECKVQCLSLRSVYSNVSKRI